MSFFYGIQSCIRSKAVISNDQAIEMGTEGLTNFLDLILGLDGVELSCSVSIFMRWFRKFHKAYLFLTEFLEQIAVGLNWILIEHVLDPGCWRQFDAYLIGLEVFEGDVNKLKSQASSVFSTASIVIGSFVGECTRN